MPEHKMKSAWEIAMEKADKLGKASPEEMRQRREETCSLVGQAVAKKFLSGLPVRDVHIELDKHQGEDRKFVQDSFLACLRDAISVESPANTNRALEAWRLFRPSSGLEKVAADIAALLGEFEKAKIAAEKQAAPQAEEGFLRQLAEEGIAGSALAVNPNKGLSTVKAVEDLKASYQAKLEKLKAALAA